MKCPRTSKTRTYLKCTKYGTNLYFQPVKEERSVENQQAEFPFMDDLNDVNPWKTSVSKVQQQQSGADRSGTPYSVAEGSSCPDKVNLYQSC